MKKKFLVWFIYIVDRCVCVYMYVHMQNVENGV